MGKSSAGEIFSPGRSDTRGQHGEGLVRAGSFRAGLDQKMSEDTTTSVKVAVEGLKRLIEADRKAGR